MGGRPLDAEHGLPTGMVQCLRESRYRGPPARTPASLSQAWSADRSNKMRKAADTSLRHWAMLSRIPVHPNAKSTKRILRELRELYPDYDVSERAVQRGLDQLNRKFRSVVKRAVQPITSNCQCRINTPQMCQLKIPHLGLPPMPPGALAATRRFAFEGLGHQGASIWSL